MLLDTPEPPQGDAAAIMLPPQIKRKYYQLTLRLLKAEYLPKMDTWGTCDGFIQNTFKNKTLKTNTVTVKNDRLLWNQEFLIPLQMPLLNERIVLKVYDQDKTCSNLFGSMLFNKTKIMELQEMHSISGEAQCFWSHIYGASLSASGEQAEIANSNEELASTWNGRVLMQVEGNITEEPQWICQEIDPLIQHQMESVGNTKYRIRCDVIQGVALPENDDYRVQLKIGEQEFTTDSPKIFKNYYHFWNYRINKTFEAPYKDFNQFPDIFIYLIKDNKGITFARLNARDFLKRSAEKQWIELKIDKGLDKVAEPYKAGLLQVK